MAKETPLINNFNAGELSPTIDARSDLQKYYSGCRTLENFIPLVEGGVERVPGTYFVSQTRTEGTITPTGQAVSPSDTTSTSASVSPSASISPSPSEGGGTPARGDGTLDNPYRLDTLNPAGGAYILHGATSPGFSVRAGKTVYYEVDPYGYTGISFSAITMWVKGFNNSADFRFYYRVVQRSTGSVLTPEEEIHQYRSLQDIRQDTASYDLDDVKFIYRIDNVGLSTATGEISWTW